MGTMTIILMAELGVMAVEAAIIAVIAARIHKDLNKNSDGAGQTKG